MEVKIEAEVEEVEVLSVGTGNFVGLPVNAPHALKPSCETCRFWGKSRLNDYQELQAYCRRRAPGATIRSWPETLSHDWCGEYEQSLTPLPDAVA